MTPYELEMQLMPHILKMEQRGVCVDVPALECDIAIYNDRLGALDELIYTHLGQRVSVDSKRDLLSAMLKVGVVDETKLARTAKTGEYSAAKDSLFEAVTEPELLGALLVRGGLATCLRTFMMPWYEAAQQQDGLIYIRWNQIRNYTDTGARTGRLSSSPNLQNIPTTWEVLTNRLQQIGWDPGWKMPQVRSYIIPKPGYKFIGRDYSAQEMRLLAHFAGGALLESIQQDPTNDIHQIAARIANISRKEAKTLGFAVLYGAGVGRIAESLHITVGEANSVKSRYLSAMPEIKKLTRELSDLAHTGMPIRTLGGRAYYVESPKVIQGRLRTFEYKLANYKIQGSAADQTKRAMLDYCNTTQTGELVLSVHDQLVAQVPIEDEGSEMQLLGNAMNGSFQEILRYQVISDPASAFNFGALK